jgi:hypothetical protein
VVIVFQVSSKEADEILAEMMTGDESPEASKQAFSAFLTATRQKPRLDTGESHEHADPR